MAWKRYLRIAAPAAVALMVGACSGSTPAPAGGSGAVQPAAPSGGAPASGAEKLPITAENPGEPKYGGTFKAYQTASAIAPHLDPQQSVTYAIHWRGPGVTLSRLLELRPSTDPDFAAKGVLQGDTAESWKQVNETTWEIKLRPGIKWANVAPVNGRELVADDVIYSLKRQGQAGFANASQVSSIKEMTAVDKHTIRFVTKEPDSGFLMNLADGHTKLIAKETVDLKGDLKNGPLIGTGPFILEDGWDRKVGYKLKKNPDFFKKDAKGRQLPYIDQLEFVVIENAALQAAVRSGQISYGEFTPLEARDMVKDNPNLILDTRPANGSYSHVSQHLGLKADKPPFNDIRVRQAFDKAIDRREIIDAVYFGEADLRVGMALPSADWHIPNKELEDYWKQDIPAAKKLMAEAGLTNGVDFEFTTKVDVTQSSIAELILSQVSKAGFRGKIKAIDNPTYADAVLTAGTYQVYNGTSLQATEANVDLYRFYYTGATGNTAGVKEPALDKLIDQQRRTFDEKERQKLLKDIQWQMVKGSWYPQLFIARPQRVTQSYVRNFTAICCYDSGYWERIWMDKK